MNIFTSNKLKIYYLSALCGLLSGLASSLFLYLLDWASKTRDQNLWILMGLPIAGFFIGFIYYIFGRDVVEGNHQIIKEIHSPKETIPFRMTPLILVGTLITHLFGGSAGREGTAVQMGASLSDQINSWFKISNEDRKYLLVAGAGAGFAGAIGAPIAGFIFGMEFFTKRFPKVFAWRQCLIAAFLAYGVTLLLKAPHVDYPKVLSPKYDINILLSLILAGVIFGLATVLFIKLTHSLTKLINQTIKYPPLRPFLGGLFLVYFYYLEGSFRFVGLGLSEIQQALVTTSSLDLPLLKGFFTLITLSSGFKGGEFIPLVFIGSTLGSAMSTVLPLSNSILASIGFSSIFGAASKTPLACAIMCMELFGYQVGICALITGYISFMVSGPFSIYKFQK